MVYLILPSAIFTSPGLRPLSTYCSAENCVHLQNGHMALRLEPGQACLLVHSIYQRPIATASGVKRKAASLQELCSKRRSVHHCFGLAKSNMTGKRKGGRRNHNADLPTMAVSPQSRKRRCVSLFDGQRVAEHAEGEHRHALLSVCNHRDNCNFALELCSQSWSCNQGHIP